MAGDLRASFHASWRLELAHLRRGWLLVLLTLVQGLSFLVLVSLFGLTGSRAPTALVDLDRTALSRQFVGDLEAAHSSFSIRPMSGHEARSELDAGRVVAIITIPPGFAGLVSSGKTALLGVEVDNVDADMTDDIERAVPSAVVIFGDRAAFPGIRAHSLERDEIPYDTGYIPYLIVSSLALDVFVVAGVVAGTSVAREWEGGTTAAWRTAGSATGLVLGKVVTAIAVAAIGLVPPMLLVVFVYGVHPAHWAEVVAALGGCCTLCACAGAALGAIVKRVVPVAALLFGLAVPLYMDSGALEPERFDGNVIWALAHLSPLYSVVGVLEDAFHGLRVTPEPVPVCAVMMAAWALAALMAAGWLGGRRLRR